MLKTLFKCLREFKKYAVITPLFVAGEVVVECCIPFTIAKLVNSIKAGCELGVILTYGAILALMAIVSLTSGTIAGITGAKATAGFAKNLRHDLFHHIQSFSFENIDKFSTSSLVTRLTTDVTFVQDAFGMIIRIAIRSPLMFIFAFVMAIVMGGKMAFIFLIVAPILAFVLILGIKLTFPMFKRVFKKYDALNNSVQENVKGMRVVKSYVREEFEKKKFGFASETLYRDFCKAERLIALNGPTMQFSLYAVMIFVLTVGSKLIVTSQGTQLDVGQFSALLTYSFMILNSLMMLSMVFVMIIISGESAKRISEVLQEKSNIVSPKDGLRVVADGRIDFDDVSFRYGESTKTMALSHIDLHIPSGSTVGIIGSTGSSKSTLVQLISRLYDPTEGTVRVGGVDVKNYSIKYLRDQVSIVLQKNLLFSGTIRENLLWGNPDATDDEIREACRLAQAEEFILQFPDGYDTYIEQGGTNVSGGQKQRLCIARALLKKPKILILDDSTSAVDTKTDALIRKGMREFIPETTKLIIAQRTASVDDADVILVMDHGRIIASGTHRELMRTCDIYQEIYVSQNRAGGDENEEE